MSDFESISGKQKVFVPFTVDKRFWDKTVPIVFFNKVYEEQVEDKEEIQFTTLVTSYTYKNDDRFQRFCIKLTEALGMILNRYHGLNESNLFWRKLLYLWIVDYATGVRFKIEQFNHLEREYPKDEYLYCSLGKVFICGDGKYSRYDYCK